MPRLSVEQHWLSSCIDRHDALLCRYTGPLQGAARAFEAVENWSKAAEAQHLLAMTANSLQNASLRNTAAAAFRRLQRQEQLHTAI